MKPLGTRVSVAMGTRPEIIKLAPLITQLRSEPNIDLSICTTGQHRELLFQMLETFNIKPDVDLAVMTSNQSPSETQTRVQEKMDAYLSEFAPQLLIVQGDTTSAHAAAVAAFYRNIPVAHVEAGLRTHDPRIPWPEEINRRVITSVASLHFAPTPHAVENLLKEGVPKTQIFLTGNTVVDSLLTTKSILENDSNFKEKIEEQFGFLSKDKKILLVTAHRREIHGDGIKILCASLKKIAEDADIEIVFPVHPNPQISLIVQNMLKGIEGIHLLPSLDYFSFIYLMMRSHLILTDSGGVQEEAPSFGKPTLVFRSKTERPEGVEAGIVRLVGLDEKNIVEDTTRLLNDPAEYAAMSRIKNPYGDGTSAAQISEIICKFLEIPTKLSRLPRGSKSSKKYITLKDALFSKTPTALSNSQSGF